jgi:alpha-2-macroglobulin
MQCAVPVWPWHFWSPLVAMPALAESPIPERRFVYLADADLPGGDIASLFDTTIDACERACTANSQCVALTYNSRNGSCFLKSGPGAPSFFQGAFSARVVERPPPRWRGRRRGWQSWVS